jgi:hypothetical protein
VAVLAVRARVVTVGVLSGAVVLLRGQRTAAVQVNCKYTELMPRGTAVKGLHSVHDESEGYTQQRWKAER